MVLKVLQKFPPTLVLVHGWLFPALVGPFHVTNKPRSLLNAVKLHFQSNQKALLSPTQAFWAKRLAGLETQTQNAAFFERKRPKRKPWHRGKSLNRKK